STLLYLAVALVAVLSVPLDALAGSGAPLALMFEHATGASPKIMALIGLFAVINGALIQIIMAARMLFGMSREGWIAAGIGEVHTQTQTPILATVLVSAGVLVLALALPLVTLAKVTSFAVLAVFALISLALIRMKRRGRAAAGTFSVPHWVPYASMISALALLGFQTWSMLR
ncbi:MAG TPA: hypothetical protein VF523_13100, partial [Burkholderiales bacterium]